ncbi:MAG: hypothetical protein EPN20_12420 [Magnetospirillum sp.]|nr:MAG: hypothetical protein EPN20_12420 [Magnetospirillum sp.]
MDKAERVRQGKRAHGNRNPMGSLEFAVRYAMDKLGAKRVADILDVGEWTLRKGSDPNQPERRLPDLSMSKVLDLVKALRREGYTEFFSTTVLAEGDRVAAVEHLPTVHHAYTLSAATHGDIGRALVEATDPDGPGGEDITPAKAAAIIDAIARHMEAAQLLQAQVLAAAGTKGTPS